MTHPSIWILSAILLGLLAKISLLIAGPAGFSLVFWQRVAAILADAATVAVLWRLLQPLTQRSLIALVVTALSPVPLLLTGYRGGTDPVMVFLLLLSVLLLQRRSHPAWGGLAFGAAAALKAWPLLLIPTVLAWLPDTRRRTVFAGVTAIVWLAGSALVLLYAPQTGLAGLLSLGGIAGSWGIPRWFSLLATKGDWTGLASFYQAAGMYLTIAALTAVGVWMQRRNPATALPYRIGLASALFLVITPVFEPGYLAWLAPWGAFLGPEALLFYSFTCGVFLWQVHDVRDLSWTGMTIAYEILSWMSALVLLLVFWSRLAPVAAAAVPLAPKKRKGKRVSSV